MSWGSRGGVRASKSKSLPIHLTVPDNRSPSRKENSGCVINIRPVSGVSDLFPGDVSKHSQSLFRRKPGSCYDADRTFYCVSITNGWEVQLNETKNVKYFCRRLVNCTHGRYHAEVAWMDGNPASLNLGYDKGKKYPWVFIHQVGASQVGRLQRQANRKCHKPAT